MSEQEHNVLPEAVPQSSPGAVLRQAREAQGLTIGEVAGALKFSPRQIEALERDDFAQLNGKTFLRGFIRVYARMLKVDFEPLLAMLDTEALPPAEQIVAPGNMGETNPIPLYRRHGKKIVLLAAFAVIAAGVAWLVMQEGPIHMAAVEPVVVAVPEQHEVVPTLANSDVPATEDLSATAAEQAPPAPPPSNTLTFEFSDRSWLEVKDGTGQVILTGEFPGGQKQVVDTKPPYQLWIGKVSAVKVVYHDQPVDLMPFARDDVARLTVGK